MSTTAMRRNDVWSHTTGVFGMLRNSVKCFDGLNEITIVVWNRHLETNVSTTALLRFVVFVWRGCLNVKSSVVDGLND